MQLKEVVITNIASLKGTHHLQFTPEYFHDNLFAITGPTGSGKSTILAAISLGLYGSHYKDKLKTTELVTLGEATGRSEVFFNYQGQMYKSVWEGTVLKSNGEPLVKEKIIRSLFRKSGHDFEMINERIEDILKLSFEQFCKTVILNQGEFSRFITSDFKERKEILERLADNNKLVQMNTKLREDINITKNEIENKQNWVAGRQHLSEENVIEISKKITQSEELLTIITKEYDQIAQNHKKFQEILGNLKTRSENIVRRMSLNDQLTIKNKDLNDNKSKFIEQQKIHHESLQHFQKIEPKLRQAEEALVKKLHLEENLTKANENKFQKQNQIKRLINEEIQLNETIDLGLKKKKHLTDDLHFRLISKNDRILLEKELLSFNQIGQEHLLASREIEFSQKDLSLKEKNELQVKSDLAQLSQLIINDFSVLTNTEALNEKADSLAQQILKYEAALVNINGQLKYFPGIERKDIDSIGIDQNIVFHKKMIDDKTKKLEFYELALSISHCHSESLKDGECVVCGQNLPSKILKPEIQSAIQGDLKQEMDMLTDLKKSQILKEDAGLKLLQFLKTHQLKDLNTLDTQLAALKSEKAQLVTKIENAREIDKKYALLQDRKSILSKSLQNLIDSNITLKQNIETLSKKLISLAGNKKNNLQSIEKLMAQPVSEINLPLVQKDLKLSSDIDHLLQTGQIQDDQLKNLKERKISEQLSLQRNEEEIQNLVQQVQTTKLFIFEIIGDGNPAAIIQQKKSELEILNISKTKLHEQLHQTELGVKDYEGRLKMTQEQIDAYSTIIMSAFHQFKIDSQKLIKENYRLWTINPHYLNFLNGLLSNLDFSKSMDGVDLDSLFLIFKQATDTIEFYSHSIKQIEKEIIEGKANLKTVADQRELIIQTLQIIENKTKELNRLKNLYDVIGKDEFRNFILSLIERQLLILANNELKNLCNDRYELVQGTKKLNQGPEFYVIDKLSGGLRRNISTLSGGETFLISLAMALGLAEMTRGQAEINSFFIDEGFGTLDQDAIEEVLEVLERMQTTGKQIGVISHIKSLTDRISVNIRLLKNSQGHSSLSIVQN